MKQNQDSIKHTYVYRLEEKSTGKFYIGYRTCLKSINPHDDLGSRYFSSGKFKHQFKEFPDMFIKEILSVFNSKYDAYVYEQELIKIHYNNSFCINRHYNKKVIEQVDNSIKVSIEFNQSIVNLSRSKKRKAINKEKKRLKKVSSYEKMKKNLVQYCDLETKAVVYMIP